MAKKTKATESPGRFYIVTEKDGGARCLVEAGTRGSALKRAAEHYCDARPATSREVVDIMRGGGDVIEVKPGEELELPLGDPPPEAAPPADEAREIIAPPAGDPPQVGEDPPREFDSEKDLG